MFCEGQPPGAAIDRRLSHSPHRNRQAQRRRSPGIAADGDRQCFRSYWHPREPQSRHDASEACSRFDTARPTSLIADLDARVALRLSAMAPAIGPPYGLRCRCVDVVGNLTLLGRDVERGTLDELLDDARNGRGKAIVVHGEPGIGKTALLEYMIASARDFKALRTVGNEAEREVPFSALQQLCAPGYRRFVATARATARCIARHVRARTWCRAGSAARWSRRPELVVATRQRTTTSLPCRRHAVARPGIRACVCVRRASAVNRADRVRCSEVERSPMCFAGYPHSRSLNSITPLRSHSFARSFPIASTRTCSSASSRRRAGTHSPCSS